MTAACPVSRGHRPPLHEPELTLTEPEHRHVRVGGLEFCFRLRAGQGWTYEGGFLVGSLHLVDGPLWAASFGVARDRMLSELEGVKRVGAPVRCPECGQLFVDRPRGEPPYEWACAIPHSVRASDGAVTRYNGALADPEPEPDEG